MHVASWRKYGKLADLGKLWFRVSSSVKDCQERSRLSFVSYFLHLCFFLPSLHNVILGGYIRVLVPVSVIYLPVNLDALVYSLTNLSPVYAPFGPKLQTKSLSYTPLVFFFGFFVISSIFALLVVAPALCLNWAGSVFSKEEYYQSHVRVHVVS